jgi:hypothetical protein
MVLQSPEMTLVIADAAAQELFAIEQAYGMRCPEREDNSRRARTNRATYELHDRAGHFTSVLLALKYFDMAPKILLGGSIYPAIQNLLSRRELRA